MLRWFLLLVSLPALCAASNLGREIAEKHAQRPGVRELRSLYAEGRTLIRGKVIDFKMWAERPNRLRIESTSPTRKVVQIYDGRHEPLISHSDVEGGRPLRMSPGERKDFIANADFDGPLMDHALKGVTVDYAGSDEIGGRPANKLLLMDRQDDVLFVWVDVETGEIVKRSVFRTAREQRVTVETFFSDFREVAGTRQPHRVETKVGAQSLYLMLIARMEGNTAAVRPEHFAVPADWPMLPAEFRTELTPRIATEARQP
jgi:outer membrane lipoprotein-sorting protein